MKPAESWREPRNETNSKSDVEDLLDLYCGWCEMLTRGSDVLMSLEDWRESVVHGRRISELSCCGIGQDTCLVGDPA